MKPIDMSPQAVTRRLLEVDELRELCVALAGPRLKRPWGVPEHPNPAAAPAESSMADALQDVPGRPSLQPPKPGKRRHKTGEAF